MSKFRLGYVCAVGAIASLGSLGCRQSGPPPTETQTVRAALNASPKTSDFVIEATNSVRFQTGGMVINGGDIGARGTGSGPFIADGVAVDVLTGVQVQTTHNIIADSVNLGTGAAVGDVQTNRLVNGTGATHGTVTALVPLPAIPAPSAMSAGTTAITVATGATVSSSPGHFGAVSVGTGSTWKLAAGSYDIASLTMSSSAKLQALGAVQIHVSGRVSTTSGAIIGPASGVTLTASGIRIEVNGINGTSGALTATPPAASFGTGNHVNALVLVPNGTLVFGTGAIATGAFMARDVDIAGSGTQFGFQDGFTGAASCTAASCDDKNPCTVDTCNANGTCSHTAAASGTSCSDGNACNGAETCDGAGACKAGTPVTCAAQDQCHTAGTCNPSTGACSNPTAANGTTCSDGNACTRTDTCQSGVCTGGSAVTCTAQDQCHTAGTCNPSTGACSNPAAANGTTCNDGNACTRADSCQAGVCTGANPVTCTAQDQCHTAGTCNPSTGACSNPAAANGTACSDGNACTRSDSCQAGVCTGTNPVTCTAQDQCHTAGTCNPSTGVCSNPIVADGTSCNDGNACTQTDSCRSGTCTGANPVTCPVADQCHTAGTCNPSTGACSSAAVANGTACNDGNPCTVQETCQAGACAGGTPVNADDGNPCTADSCSPASGVVHTAVAAGIGCADGQPCSGAQVCDGHGACVAIDDGNSCTVDLCDPGQGIRHVPAGSGTPCSNSSCGSAATCNAAGACAVCPAGALKVMSGNQVVSNGGALTVPPVLAGSGGVVIPLTISNTGSGDLVLSGTPFVTFSGANAADFSLQDAPSTTLAPGKSETILVKFAPAAAGTRTASLQINSNDSASPFVIALTATGLSADQLNTQTNGDLASGTAALCNTREARVMVRTGDIDNLGFGFPAGFDPFSGQNTPVHGYPWPLDPNDPSGTDRIFIGSSFTSGCADGYCGATARPANFPQCVVLDVPATCVAGTVPNSGLIQMFVDDFQPRVWGSLFQVTINGERATQIEDGINLLAQTGPIGQLVTFTLTSDQLARLQPGAVTVCIDDPTTGRGDGYAVDFVKLLLDVYGTDNKGTLFGVVYDAQTGQHIPGATVSAGGVVNTTADANGNYALANVPAGFVYLYAKAPGYETKGQIVSLTNAQTLGYDIAMGPNQPPVISSNPVTQVLVGATYSYTVAATDPDGDTMTWGIPQNAPPGLTINEFNGQITWSPTQDQIGVWPITVEVNDRRGGVTVQSFNITVGAANKPPTVTCQPDLHLTGSSGTVTISCPVTDDGQVSATPTLSWTSNYTGAQAPALTTSGDTASVALAAPGIYEFTLAANDGQFQTTDSVVVTLSPSANAPLIAYAGTDQTITATATTLAAITIGGAGPVALTWTQLDGPSTAQIATPQGASTAVSLGVVGTYHFRITASDGVSTATDDVAVVLLASNGGGVAMGSQGWIGSPAAQSSVSGQVPVTVGSGVTLTSGTVTYWPATNPGDTHTLTSVAVGGPGATLATLDTTGLPNGSYVIDLNATDNQGHQQESAVLVTVTGDYKPGRVVVDVPEFTVPVAGIPIAVGRRYDSLNKDKVGDFGNGWSLTMGHPDLQVDPTHNVTITLPNGRRATFFLTPTAYPFPFNSLHQPVYTPEAGVFGHLTSDGCQLLVPANGDVACFEEADTTYSPTTYEYTDPNGTVYTMGADGTLKSIQDRAHNVLNFTADGISSPISGQSVSFTRDGQGRITKIVTPAEFEYDYTYDANGNLLSAKQPPQGNFAQVSSYTYDAGHRLLTATDPAGHQQSSTYDAAGRLAAETDPMGNVTRYSYDVTGRTTTTTYADTGVVSQTFDATGMLLSQTDQLGRTTTHQYDVNRNEIKRTNALGESTTFTYDANGNQTSSVNARHETRTTTYNSFSEPLTATNPIGNTTAVAYDDRGAPTSFSDSMGALATSTSSPQGLPLTLTDARGNTAFMVYDAAGNLTSRTDRLGRETTYAYDAMGRKTAVVDPRGGTTSYTYDQDGDVTFTRNPLGFGPLVRYDAARNVQQIQDLNGTLIRSDQMSYDANNHLITIHHDNDGSELHQVVDFRGNILSKTDEAGRTTTYAYDLAGQLVKTTYADGTFTAQTYDALGRVSTKTDERGNTTSYGYEPGCDCTDRVTSVTDPLGRTTSMTYDGMGRKTSVTDPNGHTTVYRYDLRGHLIETDYADGMATHDVYDALDRRTASTDQTNVTTHYGYDAEGQLTSVTDPLGNVTQYAYDNAGNLTSVTDANGHVTAYGYDAANRKVSRTLPRGMTETFGYDGDGNVISHTDFRGKTSTYGYDGRRKGGRLVSKTPDPSLGEPTVTYSYNANSTRAAMSDASGTTAYSYDSRNRLLTKSTPEGTLTYAYDASGNVAGISSSNLNGTSVGYNWDAANQLVSVTDNRLGGMTTTVYTGSGRPSTLTQPNGVSVTYAYDSLDRVLSMTWNRGANPTLASWAYTYSPRGQRLSSIDSSAREAAYGYDAASRLTSETITGDPRGASGNGALTYSVDPVGNRLARTSTLAALGSQTFSFDPNDQVTGDTYDLNGNTTSSGGHSYVYDFENRLVSKDGGAVVLVYDGDGNRVQKTAGGTTTRYLVDDLNPTGYLQVMDEVVNGAVQVRYTFGNMLVSQTRTPGTSPVARFYGYDAHRNITFLTDANGVVTDSYAYDAWGNVVASTGSTPNTRLYGGEEFDADIGLINLRARQYDPARGRFESADSISGDALHPITQNRYLYTSGDPANWLDPSGHSAGTELGFIVAAAVVPLVVYNIAKGDTSFEAWCLTAAAGVGAGTLANVPAILATGPVGVVTAVGFATTITLACLAIKIDIDWHDRHE